MEDLLGVDWRKAWCERSAIREDAANKQSWDERSSEYAKHSGHSDYRDIFLRYLDLSPRQSVFDMGSGPGTIAIPLAKAGHQVIAADFSAGMREEAAKRAESQGVTTLKIITLDWNDDWQEKGVEPKSVDVAIASRSTMTNDLTDSLMKLDRIAREKVAVTLTTEYSPKGYKARGSEQQDIKHHLSDYIYAMNILFQLGAYPELRYIDTKRGNGLDREMQLVRWAFISWLPITQ